MTEPSCSTKDAGRVLTLVAACHRKTAPRLDDPEGALAIAVTWAELFSAHSLDLPDLLAGVKLRAQFEADAPEPADVIEFARKVRRDRQAAEGSTPEYEALCESKSEDAEELSALRAARSASEPVENPALFAQIRGLGRAVPDNG